MRVAKTGKKQAAKPKAQEKVTIPKKVRLYEDEVEAVLRGRLLGELGVLPQAVTLIHMSLLPRLAKQAAEALIMGDYLKANRHLGNLIYAMDEPSPKKKTIKALSKKAALPRLSARGAGRLPRLAPPNHERI